MDNQPNRSDVKESVRTLLSGAIDYAGLFPPAGLTMSEAVINYAAYRTSNYRWMLGRFVLPVVQLDEFIGHADDFISRDPASDWRLSVISSEDMEDTIRKISDFNVKYSPAVSIDSLEIKANTTSKIENTVRLAPYGIDVFFELGMNDNFTELVSLVSEKEQRAKIRTGGVTPDAIPRTKSILQFVQACMAANVPFKATAGLHHPIRCFRPLTYADNSVKGTMHGFLNLFMMTGFAREGYRPSLLEDVMEDEFDEVFKFESQSVKWRDEYILNIHQLETLRQKGIQSFGSCSFDEPIADLQKLGIL
ncbi:hypothetical protein BH10ACI2_BH10ACI2_25930 [soil metagenome]